MNASLVIWTLTIQHESLLLFEPHICQPLIWLEVRTIRNPREFLSFPSVFAEKTWDLSVKLIFQSALKSYTDIINQTTHDLTWYFLRYLCAAAPWAKIKWWATMYGSVPEFPTVQLPYSLEHLPGAKNPVSYPSAATTLGSLNVIQFFTLSPKVLKQKSA